MLGAASLGTPAVATIPVAPTDRTAGSWQRVWLLSGILSDAATLTTTATALMPVVNLQNRDPSKKCRISGKAGSFLLTFPGPTICTGLAWIGHNHSAGGVIRVLAGDSAAGGVVTSPALDTNYASVWPLGVKPQISTWSNWTSILSWSNTTPYKYWQVEVGDDGAELTNLQAGRLMLGQFWQPRLNFDFGARVGVTNADFRRRTPWNRTVTDRRLPGRTVRLPFVVADEADAVDQAMEMQRSLGTALDLVVSLNPAATDRFHRTTMHGTLAETGEFEILPMWTQNGQAWKFELNIEEL